jgi:hypothetical protein
MLGKTKGKAMTTKDNRTEEQKKTHRLAVVAKDRVLSGWGYAQGGSSRMAWACAPGVNVDRVYNWAKSRSDSQYVNIVNLSEYRPPRGTACFHIYVCGPDHPAANY